MIEQEIRLPYIPEPAEQRIALLGATKAVRKAVVKQASAFAQPIWWQWKPLMQDGEVNWQGLQSAASDNWPAWLSWVEGETSWPVALGRLVDLLNMSPRTIRRFGRSW